MSTQAETSQANKFKNVKSSGKMDLIEQYKDRFEDAVADSQYLLMYASTQCPKDIDGRTLNALITARQFVEENKALPTDKEIAFWLAYQRLWKLVQPATAESIKANLPIETALTKATAKSRKTINGYIVSAFLVLLGLLIVQIYWVIGNQLTTQLADLLQKQADLSQQISNNEKEFNIIEIRYQQNEISSGKYDPDKGFTFESTPEWRRDTLENVSAKAQLDTDLETLKSQLERSSTIFLIWSEPWHWLIDKYTVGSNQTHNDKYAPLFESNAQQSEKLSRQITEIDAETGKDKEGIVAAQKLNDSLTPQIEDIDAQLANLYSNDDDLRVQEANLQDQISSIDDQLKAFSSSDPTTAVGSLKINLTNQLNDLTRQAEETQKQIDSINGQLGPNSSTDPNTKSNLEDQLAALNKQAADIHGQIDDINKQLNNLSSPVTEVKKSDLENKKKDLEAQLTTLEDDRAANANRIQNFSSQRQILIAQIITPEQIVDQRAQNKAELEQELVQLKNDSDTLNRQEKAENTREDSRRAQVAGKFVLDILQGYLLPLLYGVLGAATFIIRDLSKQIEEVIYSDKSGVQHLSRIALGALAGIMVGWFTFLLPKESTSFLGSVSPLALAFLVGYNIELFFQLMDVALKKVKELSQESSTVKDEGTDNKTISTNGTSPSTETSGESEKKGQPAVLPPPLTTSPKPQLPPGDTTVTGLD